VSEADADAAREQTAILWQFGPVVCTSLTRATDAIIEVRLTSRDVIISAELFTDSDAALTYALEKLRSYNNDRSLIASPLSLDPPGGNLSQQKPEADPF
jgi:hypothetical protein